MRDEWPEARREVVDPGSQPIVPGGRPRRIPPARPAGARPHPEPIAAFADGSVEDDEAELRAAFTSAGPSRKVGGADPRAAGRQGRQGTILAAAEAYAARYRDDLKAQRHWAEAAPATVRALFQAIRTNTPGGRPRDEVNPRPYVHDQALPRLGDLSAELQALLAVSWPMWDRE